MSTKFIVTLITAVAFLLLSSPLFAGDAYNAAGKAEMGQMQTNSPPSAEKLKGMSVVTEQGEEIGEIQDVTMDAASGKISFVTLSKGGILGMGGEKDIAVPLEALRFTPDADRATLIVSKNKLENVPQQADKSNAEFQRELQSHYGISPAWQEREKSQQMMPDQEQRQDMMDNQNMMDRQEMMNQGMQDQQRKSNY